jgi:hypothetical protein
MRPRILRLCRLKWRGRLYRPALAGIGGYPYLPAVSRERELGRSQAVRQRILIPPFGGSIPPAPAIGIIKPPQSSSHLLPSHCAPDDKTLLIRGFSPQAMSCVRISHHPPRAALN